MLQSIRKVGRINSLILSVYGLAILFPLFIGFPFHYYLLLIDFVVSMPTLLFMNHRIQQEPLIQRSEFYYYIFILFVLLTIWISGKTSSILFPHLFIIPVLYNSINFSRRVSMGVAILSVAMMWLLLASHPLFIKLDQVIIATLVNLTLPIMIGYMVKEHVVHMKRLLQLSKNKRDQS